MWRRWSAAKQFDPVLSLHLKDGWTVVRPIQGYLQHDDQSAGWAVVIQWINPACPPPVEFDLRRLPAASLEATGNAGSAIS